MKMPSSNLEYWPENQCDNCGGTDLQNKYNQCQDCGFYCVQGINWHDSDFRLKKPDVDVDYENKVITTDYNMRFFYQVYRLLLSEFEEDEDEDDNPEFPIRAESIALFSVRNDWTFKLKHWFFNTQVEYVDGDIIRVPSFKAITYHDITPWGMSLYIHEANDKHIKSWLEKESPQPGRRYYKVPTKEEREMNFEMLNESSYDDGVRLQSFIDWWIGRKR